VLVPYLFDAGAARGFSGSYTLSLKGIEPVRYAVTDGELRLDVPGRTDCTLTSDSQTFLQMGVGVVSPLHALATLKIRAGGRKPWLASRLTALFPAIPHGGIVASRA
jgi:putative sterol carrier protein